ncbi:MAG: hypothetical protein PHX61_00170 [Alphaproteobacteria bacterium]|nr:hypothetical protein [Alphaproteobacteria bacterium]
MIRHLFRQKAENIDPVLCMSSVAERLYDMGYRYDVKRNNALKQEILQSILHMKEKLFSEGDICPDYIWYAERSGSDPLSRRAVLVSRTGERGELLPDDMVTMFEEQLSGDQQPSDKISSAKIISFQTVSEFLAEPHPHPFASAVARIANDARAFFVK